MFRIEVGDFNEGRASRRKARRVPALASTSAFCLSKGFPATNQPTMSKNILNIRGSSSSRFPTHSVFKCSCICGTMAKFRGLQFSLL